MPSFRWTLPRRTARFNPYHDPMPVQFKQARLANGLEVLAEIDPEAHSAACGFFVRTGARDEPTPLMGVSHFLEHMMFKGTADLTTDELNRAFDAMGARNNAYTSSELTCFYAQVLPEYLADGLSLLSRMMRPALRPADFEMEKGVILEEIAMYKDNPFWVVYEACIDRHYAPHPLSHRVLGTNETIRALTRDQMHGYFTNRYSSDNTCIALAGRIDFDRCIAVVNERCRDWAPTHAPRTPAPERIGGGFVRLRDEKAARGYAMGLARAPGIDDDRRYAALLLSQVLGASDNSRLHWSLIEPGIADEAQASYDAHADLGEFAIFISADPARLDEAWDIALRETDGLAGSVRPDDLARLRGKLATAVTLGAERPGDRMQRLGRLWTLHQPYTTLEQELARIEAVTIDDVRAIARDFPLRPRTMARLSP